MLWAVDGHAGRRDDHLRTVGTELLYLLLTRLPIGNQLALIASHRREHGECGGGVARRCGDDGLSAMPHQLAGALMLVKDELYYPILDGAARVRKLCLAVDADSRWQVGE